MPKVDGCPLCERPLEEGVFPGYTWYRRRAGTILEQLQDAELEALACIRMDWLNELKTELSDEIAKGSTADPCLVAELRRVVKRLRRQTHSYPDEWTVWEQTRYRVRQYRAP